jgi:hypothetical protein
MWAFRVVPIPQQKEGSLWVEINLVRLLHKAAKIHAIIAQALDGYPTP